MMALAFAGLAYLRAFLVSRHSLALEVLALRQQLAVWKRKQPRPKLERLDRLFWIALCQWWTGWRKVLVIVQPDTVVSWHRAGFRLFWHWRSCSRKSGRPRVEEEIRLLIRRMRNENPSWGAPRIHGELLQLGFEISEPTVSRYLQSLKRLPNSGKERPWLRASQGSTPAAPKLRKQHPNKESSGPLFLRRGGKPLLRP